MSGLDEIGALFADHVRRRDRVTARDGRHNRTVHYPQLVHPVHLELGVDHRGPVLHRTHLAGTALVMHLHGHRLHATRPIRVGTGRQMAAARHRVHLQFRPVLLESLGPAQADSHLYALHQTVQVRGVGEKVCVDHGLVERVGTAQPHL